MDHPTVAGLPQRQLDAAPRAHVLDDQAQLADALRDGDMSVFASFIDKETPRVFRACYRVLGHVEEAEDAAQEAFVRAYRGLGTYRGEGHPSAWLMRIATREAWRRAGARSRRRPEVAPIDDAVLRLSSDLPDPDVQAMRAERREQVRLAVRDLPEPYREVITLRFFADLTIPEIAAVTERPLGTIKAQVHRGLARLRDRIDGRDR